MLINYLILTVIICIVPCITELSESSFIIPKVNIVGLNPRGVLVTLEHVPGMRTVTFRGNVNSVIRREGAGEIHIEALNPYRNEWRLTDESVQVKPGDVIFFNLFVEYKQFGFLLNNSTIIRDFSTLSPKKADAGKTTVTQEDTNNITQSLDEVSHTVTVLKNETLEKIEVIATELSNHMEDLERKLNPLRLGIDSIKDILTEILKSNEYGTQLLLIGPPIPKNLSPMNAITTFLLEKLNIAADDNMIKNANLVDDGLVFEVTNEADKAIILRKSKEKLIYSQYKIIGSLNSSCTTVYY